MAGWHLVFYLTELITFTKNLSVSIPSKQKAHQEKKLNLNTKAAACFCWVLSCPQEWVQVKDMRGVVAIGLLWIFIWVWWKDSVIMSGSALAEKVLSFQVSKRGLKLQWRASKNKALERKRKEKFQHLPIIAIIMMSFQLFAWMHSVKDEQRLQWVSKVPFKSMWKRCRLLHTYELTWKQQLI